MVSNGAVYWLTKLQGCGISCPNIVNCTNVSSTMTSFLSQYPVYDSIAPTVMWSSYLNENGSGTDYAGVTNWWYTPDEWKALFLCCGITAPVPVSLSTHCDTIQSVLSVIPGVGTPAFNQNNLVNNLNVIFGWQRYDSTAGYLNNDLAYWFPQLLACGDSCTQLLSCDSISSAMNQLSSYIVGSSSGITYSVPFTEAYLGVKFQNFNSLSASSWGSILSCCNPPLVNYSDTVLSHCDQVEYLRILLQYALPHRSCLPSWVYNYMMGQFLPQLPLVTDSNVYQLCTDLSACKVTCLTYCDDSILTSCDSINSVNYVYQNLLANEGVTVDTGLLDRVYAALYGQSLSYNQIKNIVTNCNNDTAVLTKIIYSARNMQYTTSGGQTYMEFDVFATDTPSYLLFSQSNIYVTYDSTIFGTSLVGNGKITASKGLAVDSPYYNLALSDSTPTMLKIAITHTPNPSSLANLDSVNQQLCHLKINLSSFNLTNVAAAFDTIAMAGRSKYQQTPSGLEFPYDIVRVNGLVGAVRSSNDNILYQIAFDSINPTHYFSFTTNPDTVIFDIVAASASNDYLYDGDPVISYNTDAFGTNVVANNILSCSTTADSDYTFIMEDYNSGAFQIHLDANTDYYNNDVINNPTAIMGIGYQTLATCSLIVQNYCAGAHLSVNRASTGHYAYLDYTDPLNPIVISTAYAVSLGAGLDTSTTSGSASAPTIDSISPTMITAGTFSVLTIYGTGFGCTPGTVFFPNANDGGVSRMHTQAPDIQSWQENEIKVWVPSILGPGDNMSAGSGPIAVATPSQMSPPSTQSLTIPYAIKNIRDATTLSPFRVAMKNPNIQGAYIFRPASYITGDTLAAITKAMNDWKCQVGVRFIMGPDTNNAVANQYDHINTILFGYIANNHVLCATTVQTTYPTVCSPDTIAVVSDIDMVYNTNLTTTSFDTDTSDLVNVLANHNSLLGVARHEFGHAVCVQHTIEQTLMFYSDAGGGLGVFPEQILTYDQDGGLYEMLKVGPVYLSTGCYLDTEFVSPCPTLGFHLGINTIFDNPFNVSVYPNPFNESITVHANLSEANDVKVSIFDLLGQVVGSHDYGRQSGTFEESVNVSSLSAGLYLVRVSIGDKITQVKLVKK